MIKVESGMMVPLAEPFPNLAPDLPGESGNDDETSNTAAWVNQCIETGGLSFDPGLDLESLFGSLASGNFPANADLMDVNPEDDPKSELTTLSEAVERPTQPVTPISVPASPTSSDSSYHPATNPVPRHKRPSHKRAELKRRDKIKNRLDDLKAEVPSIADKGKMSESAILSKAAEYVKHLKGDCERFTTEAGNLRQEIESLSTEIHTFQEHLPAAGLKPDGTERKDLSFDQLYDKYVADRTQESWKFYLFSFFMKPLFKSYKEETTTNGLNAFMSSVVNWTRDNLGLSSLRPQSLEILREICKETDIMNHPETLPQQALASAGQKSSAAALKGKAVRPTPQPVPVQHPVSPSFTAPAGTSRLTTASRRESTTPRRSSEAERPVRDRSPKVRTGSPRNLLPAPPRQAISGGALSASPPKHFVPVMPKQVPSHQPLASMSLTPATNIVQQPLADVSTGPTPTNIFTLTRRLAATPQTVRVSSSSHVDDVTQLAASVGETSLRHSRPAAAVAPNMVIVPEGLDTKVAQFAIGGIAGTNLHFYDFDITDIPLPELPDSVLPSPQPSFTTASPFAGLTTIEAFPHSVGSSPPVVAQSSSSVLTTSHSTPSAQLTTTTAVSTASGIVKPPASSAWS